MWIELGIPRPNVVKTDRVWLNTDHISHCNFEIKGGKLTATVINIKNGGADKTFFQEDDAERIKLTLEHIRKQNYFYPYLSHETPLPPSYSEGC